MTRLVLDAGALIALDRNERPMWERLALARRHLTPLVTHGGVVGQVWRRPARLAQALQAIRVRPHSRRKRWRSQRPSATRR